MVNSNSISSIKYLLLIEGIILSLFLLLDLIPFLIILAIIISLSIFYFSFEYPFFLLNVLLFSILLGSLGIFKIGGKLPPILVLDFFFIFVFLIYVYESLVHFDETDRFTIYSLFWIPFLIWGLFSILISYDKFRALLIWRSYFAGFISFSFAFFVIQRKSQINILLISLITWGTILALIEFYILIQLGGLSSGIIGIFFRKNLLATSWGKSNYLATFFVLIIPLTIGYLLTEKSFKAKLFSSISLLLMFSAMIFTLSRGGILALFISLVLLLLRVLRKRTLIPIIITIVAVAIIILLNPLTYVVFDRLVTVEKSFSYMMRVNFYQDVWKMFIENPITGVGLGNLGYHAQFKINTHASAHNIILGLLGETGIIGAILFLLLIGKVVLKYLKDYLTEKNEQIKILRWTFLCSLIGTLIHSFMEPNFEGYQFSIMFWISVALYFKLHLIEQKEPAHRTYSKHYNDSYS